MTQPVNLGILIEWSNRLTCRGYWRGSLKVPASNHLPIYWATRLLQLRMELQTPIQSLLGVSQVIFAAAMTRSDRVSHTSMHHRGKPTFSVCTLSGLRLMRFP